MSTYHEMSVWTRGIIMDKEARDIANIVASGAEKAGFYAQMISDYVDDPDRTNCLIRKYSRFSDEPLEFKFIYENPHPDWVVLVEETLVKAVNFFRGTYDGSATLVVNSARDPEYLLKFLPDNMKQKLSKLVVVDAVGLAETHGGSPWMFVRDLGQLAYDRMSTEGANERTPVGVGIAAPLAGALTAATGVLPLDTVADFVAERDAFYRGAKEYKVLDYAETEKHVRAGAATPVGGSATT
jgi:Pyruvate/2-oxoacid:ferredoxin oxidoreductase gamma subunit